MKKARNWSAVLYPENMIDNWQEVIGDVLQLPYCYCVHDKDNDSKSEHRKDHVHLIVVFPNTTTQKNALSVVNGLSKQDRIACSTIQAVVGIRNVYDYLIHDTDSARKQGKELYDKSERISGNGFDIGSYEQLGVSEKNDICKQLCTVIIEQGFTNFTDFYIYVIENHDTSYFEVLKSNSGFFERLTKGNFQKVQFRKDC